MPEPAPTRIVVVGYGQLVLGQLEGFMPPASVVVIEDPDVIRKRDVTADAARRRCVAAVVPGRYHQDLSCIDAVEAHLAGAPVDAVVPAVEYGVFAAAALAERWGLPGASTAAAATLTDKLRLREAAAAVGLRNPAWTEVCGPDEVRRFAAGRSAVLKPANRHGSLGVQLLDADADIDAAWEVTVTACDRAETLPDRPLAWRYLAEERLVGHEYSVEALVVEGEIRFANVTDKQTAGGRHPVELGHVVPAPLSADETARFRAATARLVAAVGVRTALLHAEWMLVGGEIVLVECAGRPPGDSIVVLIDAAYDINLVRALVEALAGRAPSLPVEPRRGTAIRFVTAEPGRVAAIERIADAQELAGVVHVSVTASIGDDVRPLRSSWDRLGEVVAVGPTPLIARQRAAQAVACIGLRTETGVGGD